MTDVERLEAVRQLNEWGRANPEVQRAITGMVARHNYKGLGELADKDPGLFEIIYEGVSDLMEQLPWS